MNITSVRGLRALLRDNPIVEKDASTTMRAPATFWVVLGAGVALLALVGFVHGVNEPSARDLRYWQSFDPSGREMLVAVCGALLFLASLFVPALASSAIAAERERGTLPLLIVSSLSAERIVAGKLASLVLSAAPFFLLAVPLFGLASIYGGVSLTHLAVALCATLFHVVCLACAGLGASSVVGRARLAAPLAMLFAGVPSFFFGIPAIIAMEKLADGKDVMVALPLLVSGGAVSAAFGAACLLLARDQIAPASAPRWSLRRRVVAFVLVGVPTIAAASLRLLDGVEDYDRDEIAVVITVFAVLVMAVTAIVEVCVSDTRPRAAGEGHASPRRRALLVSALAALGFLCAALVPQAGDASFATFLRGGSLLESAHVGILVVALWVAFGAGAAALASRMMKRPPLRIALTVVFLFGLFVLPIFLHELRFVLSPLVGSGEFPLGFTNPLYVAAEMIETHAPPTVAYTPHVAQVSLAASIAFFSIGAAVMTALGKGRRSS